MSKKKRKIHGSVSILPSEGGSLGQDIFTQVHAMYGDAIRALAAELQTHIAIQAERLTINGWREQTESLPEWEQQFDRNYGEHFEIIIGAAKQFGVEPQKYLEHYFAACEANHGKTPEDIHKYLPWNMSKEERTPLAVKSFRADPMYLAVYKGAGIV